jgi:hypothetical protein
MLRRRADNLYFHTVIMLSVPSAGPGLWPGLWENSQALRRTPAGPAGPRPAAGPTGTRASGCAGPTVRSHSGSHGPNVMIIGWLGVPVQRARASDGKSVVTVTVTVLRLSPPAGLALAVTGFRVRADSTVSWCCGVAERSGPGFKSNRWFIFSRLKRLGTSSSHARCGRGRGHGAPRLIFSLIYR